MYIIACRAHFCHLLGLDQVGHCPRGTSGSAGARTGAQCGWAPSPLATPIHHWHPIHPLIPQNDPYTPRSPKCPLMPPIPLLAPEYLQSLPAPNTPLTPPDAPKTAPTPPRNPTMPPDAPIPLLAPEYLQSCQPQYTPYIPSHHHNGPNTSTPPSFLMLSFPIVVPLQLTIFMQLKCSFSIVIIFNCHHFATDYLQEYVQFTIYHL